MSSQKAELRYRVQTLRDAGLDAKWSENANGAPILIAREEGSEGKYFYVDDAMWKRAKVVGLLEAFREHTLLGDFFSVKV